MHEKQDKPVVNRIWSIGNSSFAHVIEVQFCTIDRHIFSNHPPMLDPFFRPLCRWLSWSFTTAQAYQKKNTKKKCSKELWKEKTTTSSSTSSHICKFACVFSLSLSLSLLTYVCLYLYICLCDRIGGGCVSVRHGWREKRKNRKGYRCYDDCMMIEGKKRREEKRREERERIEGERWGKEEVVFLLRRIKGVVGFLYRLEGLCCTFSNWERRA